MINPKLVELPDHEHYAACSTRLTGIKAFCVRTFSYVFISSLMLSIVSFTGLYVPLLSFIPSIFGTQFEVSFMGVQLFETIVLILLAALGYGRYKICNFIITIFYALMLIVGLTSKENFPGNIFSVIVGAGGVLSTFKSYLVYSDYEQLKKTEGYPHFNIHFTESIEKPDYSSRRRRYDTPAESVKSAVAYERSETYERMTDSYEMPSLSSPAVPDITESAEMFMDELENICRNDVEQTFAEDFIPQSFFIPDRFIQ